MTISMHSASAPVFIKMLGNMLGWLDKAEAHAAARKFDAANYLGLRLAPDMLNFTRQVQVACDFAKGTMSRLAGLEVPKWEDNEASIAELRARIQKTIDYVKTIPAAQVDGSEGREITIPMRSGDVQKYSGEVYLKHAALPNFFFHATIAYALLRHAGVDVGKGDFIGR